MSLKVYNTLRGKKEEFIPLGGKVKVFICGPTVYDYSHLGHARTYILCDCMVRTLRLNGYDVNLIMNITDLDEKIFERVKEDKVEYKVLTNRYIKALMEDFKALRINSINHFFRVSDFVKEAIRQIEILLKKGLAYPSKGNIYFDTSKFKDYGNLSKQSFEEMSLRRIDMNREKKSPQDFLLWEKADEEPNWEAPWGKGRPYWHIQDTSISLSVLGKQYDIHLGGKELIFPHHEAQIAIAESVTGLKPFVKYWIHMDSLLKEGEKMSKRRKNYISIREALKSFEASSLRLYLISKPYKSDMEFSEKELGRVKEELNLIRKALKSLKESKNKLDLPLWVKEIENKFYGALRDDFNFPEAKSVLVEFSDKVLNERKNSSLLNPMNKMLSVFGIQ
ncbi:MAG: cysteine--tRNA ligase [Nitrososphaerales archaeon]